jgi:ABC-type multidrug transport system fused ATPase/permease subunit
MEIFDIDHEVRDRHGAAAIDRAAGELHFDNVCFGYDPDLPVLEKINLDVPAGATIAIVGASGAGKSTLASLVPRLFDPTSGSVMLDGHDLRDLKLASLRKQVAVVLQDAFLFPMTVAENVSYGSDHSTREQIEAAARVAGADSFILALPQG